MAARALSGLFGYGESELDPVIQAEIHLETARNEARIAILEIVFAIGLPGLFFGFLSSEAKAVYLFCLLTVIPLLVDGAVRRAAARRLLGQR